MRSSVFQESIVHSKRVSEWKISGFFSEFGRDELKVREDWMVETCVQDDLAVRNTFITKKDVQRKAWIRKGITS